MEQGNAESAGMGEVFQERTGHLSAQHAPFFAHWYNLVALEESGVTQKRAEIWSVTGGLLSCTETMVHHRNDAREKFGRSQMPAAS